MDLTGFLILKVTLKMVDPPETSRKAGKGKFDRDWLKALIRKEIKPCHVKSPLN